MRTAPHPAAPKGSMAWDNELLEVDLWLIGVTNVQQKFQTVDHIWHHTNMQHFCCDLVCHKFVWGVMSSAELMCFPGVVRYRE